ncbi:MAG: dihydrolipoyl dehydrogenase [Acidobacteriota bacterium]|jgi:dihydrolipoamide dehydrogenase
MVVGSVSTGCEVAVIGAGPGGYLAAIRLAQLKKDVILIESAPSLGGICLNEGCIPSKALIHASDFLNETKHAQAMGITVEKACVDMPKLVKWKDKIVKKLTDGVKFLSTKNGAQVMKGRARFLNDSQLEVETDKGKQVIAFEHAVIATGSIPFYPKGLEPDGKVIIGSREALSLQEVPKRLVVIGAGYIGLELGSVYAKLGSKVEIVEFFPKLLMQQDPEMGRALQKRVEALGIKLHLNCKALGVKKGKPSKVKVQDGEGKDFTLDADKVLASVGRVPNVEDLDLEAAGVETDDKGFIKVNERMETNVSGIYAVGDVAGGMLLAHKAYREAKVAAEVIAGKPAAYDNLVVPAVIYTDPEIAWAGLTETEAKDQGYEVVTGTFPFKASGRAMTLNATEGYVKAVADAESKRILGIHIMGANASEMISEAALAIEMGAFLDDVAPTIHPHPTMSEGVHEAVEAALGEAIHILNK